MVPWFRVRVKELYSKVKFVLTCAGTLCNVDNLLRWAVNRQMRLEGGFQGRTNKLVDGCYSFWQGGIFPLLHMVLRQAGNQNKPSDLLFNTRALQEYLLMCCQDLRGGLIDKPGKSRDYYHTCYALSGLSVAQYMMRSSSDGSGAEGKATSEEGVNVIGSDTNQVVSHTFLSPSYELYGKVMILPND